MSAFGPGALAAPGLFLCPQAFFLPRIGATLARGPNQFRLYTPHLDFHYDSPNLIGTIDTTDVATTSVE
jgi:hypothetical protein